MSRVVVCSADPQRLANLQRTLHAAGLAVLASADAKAVLAKAAGAGAALVVVDAGETDPHGLVLAGLLGRQGPSSAPVLLLVQHVDETLLAPLFCGNVVDVLGQPLTAQQLTARTSALLEELAAPPHPAGDGPALALRRLVAYVQRAGASGLVLAQAPTGPVQVAFRNGQVVQAQLGTLQGRDAALAIMALPSVQGVRFQGLSQAEHWDAPGTPEVAAPSPPVATPPPGSPPPRVRPPPAPPPPLPADSPPTKVIPVVAEPGPRQPVPQVHALVVDDDEALLDIARRFLEHRGFAVSLALNGEAALELGQARPPDVVVSDIMMPGMDGWALLRAFREDHRLWEIPFIMLSCHDEYMDRLRRVGAGADAYLAKGIRGEDLSAAVVGGVARTREVWENAAPGIRLDGRLERVGPLNLLRALAYQKVTGTLHARSPWVACTLGLDGGQLVAASVQSQPVASSGTDAVMTYVMFRSGDFVFEPRNVPPPGPGQDVEAMLAAACRAANAHDQAVREATMVKGGRLAVEPSLLALYEQVTTGVPPPVLAALASGASPGEVMEQTGESPLLVEWVVRDLVRKGVGAFRQSDGTA